MLYWTLPGIAGIVLTMGMSVDANVLIFERIKEELRAGKSVKAAIADGYKGASSAIIDSNVTTLLTGVILYFFGSGPSKRFCNHSCDWYYYFTIRSSSYFTPYI